MDEDLKTMADAGVKYLKVCEDFTANQCKNSKRTFSMPRAPRQRPAAGRTAEKMIERITKIQTGNEIIQTGLSHPHGRVESHRHPRS